MNKKNDCLENVDNSPGISLLELPDCKQLCVTQMMIHILFLTWKQKWQRLTNIYSYQKSSKIYRNSVSRNWNHSYVLYTWWCNKATVTDKVKWHRFNNSQLQMNNSKNKDKFWWSVFKPIMLNCNKSNRKSNKIRHRNKRSRNNMLSMFWRRKNSRKGSRRNNRVKDPKRMN